MRVAIMLLLGACAHPAFDTSTFCGAVQDVARMARFDSASLSIRMVLARGEACAVALTIEPTPRRFDLPWDPRHPR